MAMFWWAVTFYVGVLVGIQQAKPSLSFHFPAIGPFRAFARSGGSGGTYAAQTGAGDGAKTATGSTSTTPSHGTIPIKQYSGKRAKNDSIRMVYAYDQTIAVVELEKDKRLLSCELIEVYEPSDSKKALGSLQQEVASVSITFDEMITLMGQCQQLEASRTGGPGNGANSNPDRSSTATPLAARGILRNNPLVLLSGIIPGTKWCGTGDIASDYYDLGAEPVVDQCCRAHDLCPIKVRAYSTRYNLTNDSLYTKSHCKCDDSLFYCLKNNVHSPTANIMGNIYFNLLQVPCLENTKTTTTHYRYRNARNNF